MGTSSSRYDSDFYGWTVEQAEVLHSGRLDRLDIAHVLEEIESMGRSERAQLESRLAVLLAQLLKWEFQPGFRSRSWRLTIKEQRRQVDRLLRRNPSLERVLDESLAEACQDALLMAERETGLEGVFPQRCPYSFEQIVEPDFIPGAEMP